MKRLWCSAGVLLLIVLFCGFGTFRVNRICRDAEELLRQAETCVYLGDYEGAKHSIYAAKACWSQHEGFLGIMLQHTQTGDVNVMFPGLMESVRHKNEEEFYLRNAELIASLKQIGRMELPYYFNVF